MRTERVCSECSASIEHRALSAKTCGKSCRDKRARRERKAGIALATPVHERVRTIVAGNADTVARQALAEELRPIIREAIDKSVLEAIDKMVRLTPAAVDELADELHSEDVTVRHRAAALVTKYTIGHPALVRAPEQDPPALNVHFALPRPGDEPVIEAELADTEVGTRRCDMCGAEKAEGEFVGASDRCTECHEGMSERVRDLLTD